jgi:pimeloyl-ACP methyl ester carboxylesterase
MAWPAYHQRLGTIALCIALTAALLGCTGIGVRPAEERTLLDAWTLSLNTGQDISPRTRQTLRQLDLERAYEDDPFKCYIKLIQATADDANPDQVFALAEFSYRFGRETEMQMQPYSCQYYYLCAGYAYHYLFGLIKESQIQSTMQLPGQPKLLPFNCFDPRFRLACELYNRSLEKCVRTVQKLGELDSRQVIKLPTYDGGMFELKVDHHGFAWRPEEFGPLLFCNDYTVTGLDNYYKGYGLGVPMIGSRISAENRPGDTSHRAGNYFKAVNFPITALLRFDGKLTELTRSRNATLELHNPLTFQAVNIGGYAMPMETDLTTPLAYALEKTDLASLAYRGFFRADEVERQAGIYMFEPYQKGKIPVLMVHGLLSSPLTWAPMFNDLQADPQLREKYQFWFYLYPTGNPYLGTAAELRASLAKLRNEIDPQLKDEALDRMVVVGHSMGGLIGRLLTLDGGNDFWKTASGVPLDSLTVHDTTKSLLQQVFFFKPVPSVERVIFMGTPHRGSQLSPSFLGRLGKKLVRLPSQMTDTLADIMQNNPNALKGSAGESMTSVDLLDPQSPAIQVLSHRPRPAGVQYHSVIGIIKDTNILQEVRDVLNWDDAPGDGVVRFDSAHLDDVASELIVRADHMKVHHHPKAVAEVRRILYLHLNEPRPTQGVVQAK